MNSVCSDKANEHKNNWIIPFFYGNIYAYGLLGFIENQVDTDQIKSNFQFSFLVQLLDYFSYKGQKFLAFERLSCTLHHILLKNSNKGLPLFIIKECACHILSGLDFLTTHKVVHGDIKMSNIMWNADEGAFQLVDFGFSFHEGNQVRKFMKVILQARQ